MRRLILPLLILSAATAFALPRSDKDTLTNIRYQESAAEKAAREFKEAEAELPPLPDTGSGEWFDLYVGEHYGKKPKILLNSLQIMPAPDTSIRYILNVQSANGHDNLTAEGMFCARSSFNLGGDKRSSYKVFSYGDTVNNRWIQPRKGEWKPLGQAMSRNDELRAVLYQAFCVNGTPNTTAGLIERLHERGGKHAPSLRNSYK
ncbi:CNP1-like family protein [Neisseria animalis]|uniref:Cryptic protein cnp1 n=1 Tax=Neisseria animalis TaxID=492 RepID=A0A5P3MU00_NEIAN|nr:CNP1-like family protein [Neisseria animalis]QEY25044.1 cryptic protein cnp1 [Neisseria animalis]ROW31935.1 cryptic protein cnp1 [Neisseria animalis]VEE06978.1 Cnp1 [Neisseria animalis]